MPQLGLGLWQASPWRTAGAVRTALGAGYRLLDTAKFYRNERAVGRGVRTSRAPRQEVFVTTKLWTDDQGFDRTLRAYEKSRRRLGLQAVDLYLIHWPAPALGLYLESWRALVRLQAEGRVRSIGVSNFNAEQLRRIIGETGVKPVLNQIELHPGFQQRELRAFHADQGVATQAWSPLGRGRLLAHPVIAAIAARHGKTPAQTIVRWHLDNGLIAIPKSVTPLRIVENAAVFDFTLGADDLAAIAGLDDPQGRIGPAP